MLCHAGGFGGYGTWLLVLLLGFIIYHFYAKSKRSGKGNLELEAISSVDISAMEALNRKFASGEISETEYLRKKDLLRQ